MDCVSSGSDSRTSSWMAFIKVYQSWHLHCGCNGWIFSRPLDLQRIHVQDLKLNRFLVFHNRCCPLVRCALTLFLQSSFDPRNCNPWLLHDNLRYWSCGWSLHKPFHSKRVDRKRLARKCGSSILCLFSG